MSCASGKSAAAVKMEWYVIKMCLVSRGMYQCNRVCSKYSNCSIRFILLY